MHHTEFAYQAEIGSEMCTPPAVIFPVWSSTQSGQNFYPAFDEELETYL